MSEISCCDSCGKACLPEELVSFDGQLLCPDCLSETTMICDRCGERIWKDDNAGDSVTTLCQSCYDRWYVSCSRCGAIIHESDARYARGNDDDPLCDHCYTRHHGSNAINDYYYRPEPVFYGDGPLYMGVELEIDGAGEVDSNARKLLDAVNIRNDYIYCKHDGSLDDGFEIVTNPMTLNFHQKEMPWETILQEAISMGYTSHQARTCGLHVHVNRDAFGSTAAQQDACIARILYIFEKFWDELLKFSRRTPRQLERWACRYGYKDQPKEILDNAKKGYGNGRYTCVNLQNAATIEFRMFRGTLKYNTIIATLQLVQRVCDVALCLSDEELQAMSWTTFAAGCTQPELVQYLKERRLYVNEPVSVAEEV